MASKELEAILRKGGTSARPAVPGRTKGFWPTLGRETHGILRTITGAGRGIIEFPMVAAEAAVSSIPGLRKREATEEEIAEAQRALSKKRNPLKGVSNFIGLGSDTERLEDILGERGLRLPGEPITIGKFAKQSFITPFAQAKDYIASPSKIVEEAHASHRGVIETALEPVIGIAGTLAMARGAAAKGAAAPATRPARAAAREAARAEGASRSVVRERGREAAAEAFGEHELAQRIHNFRPIVNTVGKGVRAGRERAATAVKEGTAEYLRKSAEGEVPSTGEKIANWASGTYTRAQVHRARQAFQRQVDTAAAEAPTMRVNVASELAMDQLMRQSPDIDPAQASDLVGWELSRRVRLGADATGQTLVEQVAGRWATPEAGEQLIPDNLRTSEFKSAMDVLEQEYRAQERINLTERLRTSTQGFGGSEDPANPNPIDVFMDEARVLRESADRARERGDSNEAVRFDDMAHTVEQQATDAAYDFLDQRKVVPAAVRERTKAAKYAAQEEKLGTASQVAFDRAQLAREAVKEALRSRDERYLREVADVGRVVPARPDEFHEAFESVFRDDPKYTSHVTHYTPEELADPSFRLFQAYEGRVGGALKDHGDGRIEITALYNRGGPKGAGGAMIEALKAEGGNYLEAYGGYEPGTGHLPMLYAKHGFVEAERFPFDRSQAAPGWDYATHGEPDYVIMNLAQEAVGGGEPGIAGAVPNQGTEPTEAVEVARPGVGQGEPAGAGQRVPADAVPNGVRPEADPTATLVVGDPNAARALEGSPARTQFVNRMREAAQRIPDLRPGDVDMAMAITDVFAVNAAILRPDVFKNPNDAYRMLRASYSKGVPKDPSVLMRRTLGYRTEDVAQLVKIAREYKHGADWYRKDHAAIQEAFKDASPTQLYDGTEISTLDLAYQITALTSPQKKPSDNFNIARKIIKDVRDGLYIEDVLARSGTTDSVRNMIEEVLSGNTMDKWSPQDMYDRSAAAHVKGLNDMSAWLVENGYPAVTNLAAARRGAKEAKAAGLVPPPIPGKRPMPKPGETMREYVETHGERAKVYSFWQNLKNASDPNFVTVDTWMALFFGDQGVTSKNYKVIADSIRETAAKLKWEPRDVQAALWIAAKEKWIGQEVKVWERALAEGRVREQLVEDIADATKNRGGEEGSKTLKKLKEQLRQLDAGTLTPERLTRTKITGARRGESGAGFTEAIAELQRQGEPLYRELLGEVTGAVAFGRDGKAVISLMKSADFVTYAHELAHVARRWAPQEHLDLLERAYGIKDGKWTRGAEERFARDAEDYLGSGRLPNRYLRPVFDRMRDLLKQIWDTIKGRGADREIAPEVRQVLDEWFAEAPKVEARTEPQNRLRSVPAPDYVKGTQPSIAFREGVVVGKAKGTAEAALREAAALRGAAQAARRRAETQAYRLTELERKLTPAQRAVARDAIAREMTRAREQEARAAQIEQGGAVAAVEETQPQFAKGTPPKAAFAQGQRVGRAVQRGMTYEEMAKRYGQRQATARKRMDASIARAMRIEDTPTPGRAAARWQPFERAFRDAADNINRAFKDGALTKEQRDIELANIPQTVHEIMDLAMARGFDPAYLPDMSPQAVMNLARGNVSIGAQYPAYAARRVYSGARKAKTGAMAAQGMAARNAELLRAAWVDIAWERGSHAFVDWFDANVAIPLPRDANGNKLAPPETWVEFHPEKYVRRGPEAKPGEPAPEVFTAAEKMIPKTVHDYLSNVGNHLPTNNWGKAFDSVSGAWRVAVLLLSPRWYVNNALGNMVLAIAHGVSLRDWVNAVQLVRTPEEVLPGVKVRGASVPGALRQAGINVREGGYLPESAIVREGEGNVVQRAADRLGRAKRYGGVRGVAHEVANSLQRANTVVDEIARTAMMFSELRKQGVKGDTPWEKLSNASRKQLEQSVNAGIKNMVDYGDMSWFERKYVRRIVPFYSWQKGMLKVAMRLPVNHPSRTAIFIHLGNVSRELQEDRRFSFPEYLQNYVPLGHSGKYLAVRGMNPFGDAAGITTAEGIAQSLNPLVEAFTRAGFNISDTGYGPQVVDQYGRLVDDVRLSTELYKAMRDLPVAQLVGKSTGLTPSYDETNATRELLKFLGLNVRTRQELEQRASKGEQRARQSDASQEAERRYRERLRNKQEAG